MTCVLREDFGYQGREDTAVLEKWEIADFADRCCRGD